MIKSSDAKSLWGTFVDTLQTPIAMYLKYKKIESLSKAMEASKNVPAGHRIYLRCATLLEKELNINNPDNAEIKEGFYVETEEERKERLENNPILKKWIAEKESDDLEIDEKENKDENEISDKSKKQT